MIYRFLSFALACITAAFVADSSPEEKGKPRFKSVTGVVSKVQAGSLTITQRGDSGERQSDFSVGAQTKIAVESHEDTVTKGEGGSERKTPKTRDGTVADLKVDQRVTVRFTEVGKADSVLIMRPAPPRKKEGER